MRKEAMLKITIRSRLAVAAIAAAALLSVTSAARAQDGVLRVGGSTTLVPVVTNAAMAFMDSFKSWRRADAALPDVQPVIYVTGGGSGFGINSAISDTLDIGLASRELKDSEKAALGAHHAYLVGKDAVAVAVQVGNPLAKLKKNLTSDELRKIFSGEYHTYRDIDAKLPAQEIVLLVRDTGAGSAEILQDKIMGKAQVAPNALQMPSQGALLKKLESNPNAIAYISAGIGGESGQLVTFALNGIEPSNANVVSGAYELARPLLMIVKGETPSPMAKRFVDYVLNEGQEAIAAQGYVPVRQVKTAAVPQ
jgi:phosphate transport system substrate-binding protein